MAVDRGGHFLPGEKCNDFLLGRDKLSALGPFQRLADEMGKHFNLCVGEKLSDPGKDTGGVRFRRGRVLRVVGPRRVYENFHRTF